MKRNIIILLMLVMSLSFAGCGIKEEFEKGVKEGIREALEEQQKEADSAKDDKLSDGESDSQDLEEDEADSIDLEDSVDFTKLSDDQIAVQEDLLNYINVELLKIVDIEAIVTEGYDSVSGDNYTDDYTMYNMIEQEVLPASVELVDTAEGIEVSTKEVRDIHELYIEAVNIQHQAFGIILSAIEKQDYELISEANEKLSEARKKMRDYMDSIEALSVEVGVELNYNE